MICFNKPSINSPRYLLSILMLLPLLGCQQTKLVFTDEQAPVTPTFNRLEGAPQPHRIKPELNLGSESWAPQVHPLTANFTLHLFPPSPSELNYIELVLINSDQPFNNIDILNTALNERAIWLASQHPISCIESLRIRAGMHSISIKMACPAQEIPQSLSILNDSWQDLAFEQIDIDNVRRKLKLNKHINAYSGAEIDKVWANIILGDKHPYNQALHNLVLQDELSLSKLSELQQEMRAGANWHLFMSLPANHPVSNLAQSNILTQEDLIEEAERLAERLTRSSAVTAKEEAAALVNALQATDTAAESFINTDKIIYLIDAPGAVQTQVRVGYRLPLSASSSGSNTDTLKSEFSSSHPLSCQLFADWLGRSFSGRLYFDLREKRGLTYGIYGRCFDNPLSRTLKYYGSTQLQHTGAFVAGILAHLQLTTEQEVASAELSALKTFEESKYTLTMQSQYSSKIQYIKQLTLKRSSEDLADIQLQIKKLTGKELMQMSQSIFDSPPYILLRGDADKISGDLKDKLPDWHIEEIEP
ncbi:insulinase family protein [Shewanella benthica]|uniref:insulinase family protein n=1 Tax=Shewanella benthica TaxID=43661 RepID=UPI0018796EE4|nr:insulinase family protein [Shewanella benthica]MBE7214937.1 insulinase family protein [Shewanella benthica]MCL1062069.1 insulinase family protein [Shewanella benthica]